MGLEKEYNTIVQITKLRLKNVKRNISDNSSEKASNNFDTKTDGAILVALPSILSGGILSYYYKYFILIKIKYVIKNKK